MRAAAAQEGEGDGECVASMPAETLQFSPGLTLSLASSHPAPVVLGQQFAFLLGSSFPG